MIVADIDAAVLGTLTKEKQRYLLKSGQNAIEIGKRLTLMKTNLPHGKWKVWLSANFDFSYRAVAQFMQMASLRYQNLKQKNLSSLMRRQVRR